MMLIVVLIFYFEFFWPVFAVCQSLGAWAEIFKVWDVGQRLGIDTSQSRKISDKLKILMVPKETNGAELWVGSGFSSRALA